MKLLTIIHIAGCIGLLLFLSSSAHAENCLEAREWYEEGLSLADNSVQEASFYQQAIHLCPEFVAAHNRLGEVYKHQGKYALSIQAFEQARIQALSSERFATRSDSQAIFLESAVSLGEIYRIQGKYERAAEEFIRALEVAPDSRAAQNNLQYVYKRLHRYDDVLPQNNQLLANAIFTRISGATLPDDTFTIDFHWKHWKQESPAITQDMFTDDIITLEDIHHTTLPRLIDEGSLVLNTLPDLATRVDAAILSMRYGLTNDITVGLVPKVLFQSIEPRSTAFTTLEIPTSTELGDTELLVKYHLWGKRKQHLSFFTLFNLPTGREAKITSKEPFTTQQMIPQESGSSILQTFEFDFVRYVPAGSESFDITPGIAFTLGLEPFIVHSNMQYRFTDGNLIGDEFRFNIGTVYRMYESVNATMEANFRWTGDARRRFHAVLFKFQPAFIGTAGIPSGPVVVESFYTAKGGSTLFLSPGLQFAVGQNLRLEMGMQIPVIRQTEGWTEGIIYQVGLTFMSF